MLTFLIAFIVSVAVFLEMKFCVDKWDKDITLDFRTNEIILAGCFLTINSIMVAQLYDGRFLDAVFFSAFLSMVTMMAVIDHRTHQVHRIFSVSLDLTGALYFVIKVIVQDITGKELLGYLFYLIVAVICITLLVHFHVIGKGDRNVMYGSMVYIPIMVSQTRMFHIESLAVYYLIANIIMVAANLKNISWKRRGIRAESEIAFIPDLYAAAMIMMALLLFYPDIYQYL